MSQKVIDDDTEKSQVANLQDVSHPPLLTAQGCCVTPITVHRQSPWKPPMRAAMVGRVGHRSSPPMRAMTESPGLPSSRADATSE